MPNARLRVVDIASLLSLGDLGSSEVDLHVGVRATGPGIHAEPLLDDRAVLVARKDHPACARRLSRHRLGSLRHVSVEMAPGRGIRDRLATTYARARTERTVTLTVPTFAAAAAENASSALTESDGDAFRRGSTGSSSAAAQLAHVSHDGRRRGEPSGTGREESRRAAPTASTPRGG